MDFFVGFLALAGFACLLLLPWPLCRSLFPASTVPLPHLGGGACVEQLLKWHVPLSHPTFFFEWSYVVLYEPDHFEC